MNWVRTAAVWAGLFGNLYPSYVRGEADRRRTVERKPLPSSEGFWSIAELSSAIPSARSRPCNWRGIFMLAIDHAKYAYEDFLKLWKDADPEIPILKQAEANTRSCSSFKASRGGARR